jgi:hypothetical protein
MMKPMIVVAMLLSLAFGPMAQAGAAGRSYEGLDRVIAGAAENASHAREWTDHNVHDPGITILEAVRRVARRVYRAVIRFGDGLRGRRPAD